MKISSKFLEASVIKMGRSELKRRKRATNNSPVTDATKNSTADDLVSEIQLESSERGVIFEGSIQLNTNIRVAERCLVEHLSRVQCDCLVQDLSVECHHSSRHYFIQDAS